MLIRGFNHFTVIFSLTTQKSNASVIPCTCFPGLSHGSGGSLF